LAADGAAELRRGALLGALGISAVVAAGTPAIAITALPWPGSAFPQCRRSASSAAAEFDPRAGVPVVNAASYGGYATGNVVIGAVVSMSSWRLGFLLPLLLVVVIAAMARDLPTSSPVSVVSERITRRDVLFNKQGRSR
jgi:hypothetical protein